MKTLRNKIASVATAVLLGMGSVMISAPAVTAQNIQISYNDFYQELSPYGVWYNDPMYGYVWQPNVEYGFRPYYTNGYWAMTEYGNMWISNYQWGWATFHYGRWALSNYGWIWVPGTEWGPAWVDWRQGNGYYGWAPMAPGINMNIYFGSGYNTPFEWFTFVPYGNIYNRNFHAYNPPRTIRNHQHFTRITHTYRGPRNNNAYAFGPRANEVRQHTRRDVPVYTVRNAPTQRGARVTGNTVEIYQPRVNSATNGSPRNVRSIDAATNSRNTNNVNQGNRGSDSRDNRTSNQGVRNQDANISGQRGAQERTTQDTRAAQQERAAQQRQAQTSREQANRLQQEERATQQRQAQASREQANRLQQEQRATQQRQEQASREQANRLQQEQRATQQRQEQASREQANRLQQEQRATQQRQEQANREQANRVEQQQRAAQQRQEQANREQANRLQQQRSQQERVNNSRAMENRSDVPSRSNNEQRNTQRR
jgi:hypothetical protein